VDAGLILAAEDEAELAGVMAHEIAHIAACHAARGRTREQLMQMASLPLMMISGPVGYAAYESLTIAAPLTFMKFSRRFESEADFLGVQYMYKAGYDPQAFIAFFERIRNLDKRKENLVVKAFRTHPPTVDRIERTQQEIGTLLPLLAQYKVDSSELHDIKERLSQAENGLHIERYREQTPKLKPQAFCLRYSERDEMTSHFVAKSSVEAGTNDSIFQAFFMNRKRLSSCGVQLTLPARHPAELSAPPAGRSRPKTLRLPTAARLPAMRECNASALRN